MQDGGQCDIVEPFPEIADHEFGAARLFASQAATIAGPYHRERRSSSAKSRYGGLT